MNRIEQLIISLMRVTKLSQEALRPNEEDELNPGLMFLLFLIATKKEIKTTEIASYFDVTPGAATGIADKLERMELIERKRKHDDRRVIVVTLSSKGETFVEERKQQHVRLYAEMLGDLTEEELTIVILLLNKIGDRVESHINK